MSDDIKNVLYSKKLELKSSGDFYGCIIQNSMMSSTPQRIEAMKAHQLDIYSQSEHQDFKSQSAKCLTCVNILTCSKKC